MEGPKGGRWWAKGGEVVGIEGARWGVRDEM